MLRPENARGAGGVIYYRCIARTLAPGSPALADHPKTVNLRESHIIKPLNHWLSGLFNRTNRAHTIARLVEAQNHDGGNQRREMLRAKINAAETKLTRHRTAIEAGVDPLALVEAMNAAQAEKAIAQAEMEQIPQVVVLTAVQINKLIDSLGDMTAVLNAGAPEDKIALYTALNVEIHYDHRQQIATVLANPCVVSTGVRRGYRPVRQPAATPKTAGHRQIEVA